MKNLFICSTILSIGLLLSACDETTPPGNNFDSVPSITELTISPKSIQFSREDGLRDTTINLYLEVSIENNHEEIVPRYSISDKRSGEIIIEGEFENNDANASLSSQNILIETATYSFEEYLVNALIYNDNGDGNYAQTTFQIKGLPNDPPVILEADNPEEVQIPSGDEVRNILFSAKVTDPDGQDNIDRVLLEFINEDGSRLVPNPNQLLDDGQNGDVASGDSVYTIAFSIDSSNTPNNRTVQYFAIDKTGLSSDTVETTFNIVE